MKKLALLISLIIMLSSFTSCIKLPDVDGFLDSVFDTQTLQEQVAESIGQYDNKEIWTHGGFQDYTDYGIYSYTSANLNNNQYFKPVTYSDSEKIKEFIDNFEGWVDVFKEDDPDDELVSNYNFDRSIIDTSDYFYIFEKDYDIEFAYYDVYFFDVQTNVLYYFHNNI